MMTDSGGKISIDKRFILHLALNTLRGQTGLFSVKVCNQDRKLCVDGTPCWVKFSLQHCIYLLLLWNKNISMHLAS